MSRARTVYVTCPFCSGMLEVNAENGTVIRRFEAKAPPPGGDKLAEAVEEVKRGAETREEKFKAAQEKEKHKLSKLEQAFRDKKRETEESGDTGRPLRPFDLE